MDVHAGQSHRCQLQGTLVHAGCTTVHFSSPFTLPLPLTSLLFPLQTLKHLLSPVGCPPPTSRRPASYIFHREKRSPRNRIIPCSLPYQHPHQSALWVPLMTVTPPEEVLPLAQGPSGSLKTLASSSPFSPSWRVHHSC